MARSSCRLRAEEKVGAMAGRLGFDVEAVVEDPFAELVVVAPALDLGAGVGVAIVLVVIEDGGSIDFVVLGACSFGVV